MSYFNEIVGPENGHYHLLDSNIDWGQDLFIIERWLDDKQLTDVGIKYYGVYQPRDIGIPHKAVPPLADLSPGWYVVSVNFIHGYLPGGNGKSEKFAYFQHIEPYAKPSFRMYVYKVSQDDIESLKKKMGR